MDFLKYVLDENLGEILKDAKFKDITTIRIGGTIKYLYLPNSIDSLCRSFKFIKKYDVKYYIVSGGSNILATDEYFDGVVILLKSMPSSYQIYDDTLVVDAFYPSSKLAKELSRLNIGNLAFLANIPGLIGGAIKQNAGAFNNSVSQSLIECKYIDSDGVIKTLSNQELNFDYRSSIFYKIDGIVIQGTFKISQNENTTELIEEQTRLRRQNQPISSLNMGSIFKNDTKYKAWKIIDNLGLRGHNINDAVISDKHTNFIINKGTATYKDVATLINLIKDQAYENYNVNLECEINIVK